MRMTGWMALAGITVLLGVGTWSFQKGLQQARRTTCANHLAQIAGAKGSHGLENRLAPGTPVSPADLSRLLKSGWDGLRCPSGGRYEPGLFTGDKETGDAKHAPSCSVHGSLAVLETTGRRPWIFPEEFSAGAVACCVLAAGVAILYLRDRGQSQFL